MPVKSCTINGKKGYKWGNSGKCYTGPGAKKKALRQGAAAYANGYREGKTNSGEYIQQLSDLLIEAIE